MIIDSTEAMVNVKVGLVMIIDSTEVMFNVNVNINVGAGGSGQNGITSTNGQVTVVVRSMYQTMGFMLQQMEGQDQQNTGFTRSCRSRYGGNQQNRVGGV